ncbi:hypothetical protein D3C78_1622890 [compost metagenome]
MSLELYGAVQWLRHGDVLIDESASVLQYGGQVAFEVDRCLAFAHCFFQRTVTQARSMVGRAFGGGLPVNGHRLMAHALEHLLQRPGLHDAAVVFAQGLGHDGDFH